MEKTIESLKKALDIIPNLEFAQTILKLAERAKEKKTRNEI